MKKLFTAIAVSIAGIGAFIALERANRLGLNNVFSREHVYVDDRPLTDTVAIELTRNALKADGRKVEQLVPYKGFARNSINANNGYVLWGPLPAGDPWQFLVSIRKNDSDRYHVRAVRGK